MANIPYASVLTTERLPVDAQDVVTRVRLVIAGNRAGAEPTRLVTYDNTTNALITYVPDPIVFEYEAPEHSAYGCTRSFALPEGFNPFLAPGDPLVPEPDIVSGFDNPGSPSAVRDGDPITYASLGDGASGLLRYHEGAAFVGFRLKLVGTVTGSGYAFVSVRAGRIPRFGEGVVTPSGVFIQYDAPRGSDSDSDEYAVVPHDARHRPENRATPGDPPDMTLRLAVGGTTEGVRVHEFYPLIPNEALLLEVARANVRLPALNPQRVVVAGIIPPDREHTITGWPGGDYTGRVAQHQYELGRTFIDFEQAGAPAGLPAEAIESARERTAAVQRAITTANYGLIMGERQ